MVNIAKVLVILLIFLIHIGCKVSEPKQASRSYVKASQSSLGEISSAEHESWMNHVNNDEDSLGYLYHEKAVKVLPTGQVLNDIESIMDYYTRLNLQIIEVKTAFQVVANESQGRAYEIGSFRTKNGRQYAHLIIWKSNGNQKLREFELISEMQPEARLDKKTLNKRREYWMELCNKHEVSHLVHELYSPNPLYYNHKPVITHRDSLIEEYQYMARETYQLSLSPLYVQAIHDSLVFEIGQCAGGYNGKYILIWKKDEVGRWKVWLDSNI